MNNSAAEKANAYDKSGLVKTEVEKALSVLKGFRVKFPFAENLRSIEWLDPDKLFKLNPDEVGEFFRLLEANFQLLGNSNLGSSNIYRNARLQIKDFRNLLRITVDSRKSLAQKVDAPWEKIGGLGQDKQLAEKIIYCFNYENGAVLPIFSNRHLRHFVNRVADTSIEQAKYYSLGQEYEGNTTELIRAKNSLPLTKSWGTLYFTLFLYQTYPPPDTEPRTQETERKNTTVTDDQLDMQGFVKLLGELQRKGKITGEEFRENRELWKQQQPNDRDLLVWRLRQLLSTETKKPHSQRNSPLQKPRRL